jgi:formylglycine-generating enzyme required for sulfatase activity
LAAVAKCSSCPALTAVLFSDDARVSSKRRARTKSCAASGNEDCCGWAEVEGGSFNRLNIDDDNLGASVSSFKLDLFEVTMGRFRPFFDAYPDTLPDPGDGAHFLYPESGWRAEWQAELPPNRGELNEILMTDYADRPCLWDATAGDHERVPMECVPWYIAFAFCAWDGGRLPSFAEWNYALAGGDEQRTYPWGEEPYDLTRAVYLETPDGVLA